MQQANQELAQLQFLRQALENEIWLRNAGYGVGYMPVVTWLPEGTWFGAGANISPDGRYARINANPFYSSVGPVYTYNLNNGATQSWMPQSGYQPNNQPLGSPGFNHAETYGGIPARQQSQAAPRRSPESGTTASARESAPEHDSAAIRSIRQRRVQGPPKAPG